MADRLQDIERALNQVESVGQAVAAVRAAQDEIERGRAVAADVTGLSITDFIPFFDGSAGIARQQLSSYLESLTIAHSQLAAEARNLAGQAQTGPVAQAQWGRVHRAISGVYGDVYAIEGVAGVHAAIDPGAILSSAIKDAPRVFGQALGVVAKEVGEGAAQGGKGFFSGLGLVGSAIFFLLLFAFVKLR